MVACSQYYNHHCCHEILGYALVPLISSKQSVSLYASLLSKVLRRRTPAFKCLLHQRHDISVFVMTHLNSYYTLEGCDTSWHEQTIFDSMTCQRWGNSTENAPTGRSSNSSRTIAFSAIDDRRGPGRGIKSSETRQLAKVWSPKDARFT